MHFIRAFFFYCAFCDGVFYFFIRFYDVKILKKKRIAFRTIDMLETIFNLKRSFY